jgi:ribosomal protein S18 acetylase RimI-like enzyme
MLVEIRKALTTDLPYVLQLYAEKDMDNNDTLSADEAQRIYLKMQSYPNYAFYIAIVDERVAGTFELLIMDNLAHKGKPSGIVEDVVVASAYRSLGIGRKMMDYAMNICKECGCYKLVLSSSLQRSRAHSFYENLGFRKHGYSFLVE